MSEEQKPAEVEVKVLTRETLERQIATSERAVASDQQKLASLQQQIEQNLGILNYARHLLKTFALPSDPKPEEKRPETPLEVK